jgi:hypothetical protein
MALYGSVPVALCDGVAGLVPCLFGACTTAFRGRRAVPAPVFTLARSGFVTIGFQEFRGFCGIFDNSGLQFPQFCL